MIKKYKKELIIFLIAFTIYLSLGLIFTYYLNTYNYWGAVFDLDTPRIFGDLSLIDYNHYRAKVHPLFIIIFQPIVLIIKFFIKDAPLAILLLQSLIGATSLVLLYCVLKKIGIKDKLNIVLAVIFGLSFTQTVFTANIETYIFAQVFLIGLWLYTLFKIDKELKYWDYIMIVLLGILSLAITITNFVQFIIALFFLVLLNKKVKNSFFTCCFIGITVIALSVLLATMQQIVWPSAPNFFVQNITDFLHGTSEETLYITKDLTFNQVINVANGSFAHSFNLFKLAAPISGAYQSFEYLTITNILSLLLLASFIGLNIFFIIKTKFNINKHKFYYGMLSVYVFNSLLHLFYGNPSTFLYTCHFNFSIIILLAYILNYFNKNDIKNKWLFYSIILINIALALYTNIALYINLSTKFVPIEHMRILPMLIIISCIVILSLLIFKKIIFKILFIVVSSLLILGSWFFINKNNDICTNNCDEFSKYQSYFNAYDNQLKDMKNRLSVQPFIATTEPIGIYYFGLADRRKMVYKDGKLYDIRTNEIIKEIDYTEELIVPNEYAVILKDKDDNIYKIIENEKGVFFYENEKEEEISIGNKKIILPDFKNNQYSEILKVLHQEILFNIDGDIPRPNILCYENTEWYRDAMLGTMVLEKTNNTSLLENWVKSINKIYDNSRDPNVNETDNLGELLYIIGAVGVDRKDLVKEIINEIYALRDENWHISGIVDGSIQTYYPTLLAVFGAKKNNIDLDLKIPEYDDCYAYLTWYSKTDVKTSNNNNYDLYPYLNWGGYHYLNYGPLRIIDEIYPLSYEASSSTAQKECAFSEFYCESKVCLSHMWHAAEMFLLLEEIG